MEVITNLTKYESFVMDYVAAKTVSGEWTDEDSANPVQQWMLLATALTQKYKSPQSNKERPMTDLLAQLLPAITALLYGATSACYLAKGNHAWALVWGCYALANVGLILAADSGSSK